MTGSELQTLIDRYLDGLASEPEIAALSRELETNEAARREYLRIAHVHAVLAADETMGAAPIRTVHGWDSLAWIGDHRIGLAAAAVALLLALAAALAWPRAAVARFGPLQDCRWVGRGTEPSPGDRLAAGQRIELSSGSATVHFASGAVATLVGPCIFEVESRNSGLLTLGQVKAVAATPESKGFSVRTRTARVVDVGTEFVAAAAADGQSRVDVTSGEVYVLLDGVKTPHRLRTGDALSVEAGRTQVLVRIESGDGTAAFIFPTIEPPSNRDYADHANGRASVRVAQGELHVSGPIPSGNPEVLLDGRGQARADSPAESVFFGDNDAGLLLMDLGQPILISRINTYSWHQSRHPENRVRAVQKFTVYGYAGDEPPSIDGAPADAGWTPIARVNSDDFFRVIQPIDRPAQQACSIAGAQGPIGRYRYLLWEVLPTQTRNRLHLNNTFYAEFDVYGAP